MKRTIVFPPCGASEGTSVKEVVTEAMSALKSGAYHDVAKGATAGAEELVQGNDPRLEDARSASDVFRWAKARTKPAYTAEEVGAAYAVHDHPVATYTAPGFMSPVDKKVLKDFEQVIKKGGYVNDTDPRLSDARTPLEHTHDLATSVRAGFMSPQDKAKLDKVSTGAGASPTGAAGGVLAGEYPNPSFAVPVATLEALAQGLGSKVDKEGSKRLSTNDFTDELKEKLENLEGTHWKGVFNSLSALNASVSNPVAGDYADVTVPNEDTKRYVWNTDLSEWTEQAGFISSLTANQVKILYEANDNTNTYTDSEKALLGSVEEGATKNAPDPQLRDRSTHTGTQSISTVEGLTEALDTKIDNNDPRVTLATETAVETGTAKDVVGWSPLRVWQAISSWWNGLGTVFGKGFIVLEDAAAARTKLELGSASVVGLDTLVRKEHEDTRITQNEGTVAVRSLDSTGDKPIFAAESYDEEAAFRVYVGAASLVGGAPGGNEPGWFIGDSLVLTEKVVQNAMGQSATLPISQKVVTDAINAILARQNPAFQHYFYDNDGLIVQVDTPEGSTYTTYNPDQTVNTITFPSGRVETYSYDSEGRLVSMLATNP